MIALRGGGPTSDSANAPSATAPTEMKMTPAAIAPEPPPGTCRAEARGAHPVEAAKPAEEPTARRGAEAGRGRGAVEEPKPVAVAGR